MRTYNWFMIAAMILEIVCAIWEMVKGYRSSPIVVMLLAIIVIINNLMLMGGGKK